MFFIYDTRIPMTYNIITVKHLTHLHPNLPIAISTICVDQAVSNVSGHFDTCDFLDGCHVSVAIVLFLSIGADSCHFSCFKRDTVREFGAEMISYGIVLWNVLLPKVLKQVLFFELGILWVFTTHMLCNFIVFFICFKEFPEMLYEWCKILYYSVTKWLCFSTVIKKSLSACSVLGKILYPLHATHHQ